VREMNKKFDEKEGSALMLTLFLTVLLILMTVSMVFISTNTASMSLNVSGMNKALKAAEAGVEYAIYRLNEDPSWGVKNLDFSVPNKAGFAHDESVQADVQVDNDSRFKITFSGANPEYRSVNNLFQADASVASAVDTPCYTAKIISVGVCGGYKKVLKAYLIRSDYYTNSINSQGVVNLVTGNFAIKSSNPDHTMSYTPVPGVYYPGTIYSEWKSTPGAGNYSIRANSGVVNTLDTAGGLLLTRGKVILPSPVPTFSGSVKENYPEKSYMGKIDVDKILERAQGGDYGPLNSPPMSCMIIASDYMPTPSGPGEYTSQINPFPPDTPDIPEAMFIYDDTNEVLTLESDLFVNGNKLEVYNDRYDDWPTLIGNPNVFRIAFSDEAYTEETITYGYEVVPTSTPGGVDPTPVPGLIEESKKVTYRNIVMDLNGHTIYSNSHIIINVPVKGEGKIISGGKLYLLISGDPGGDTVEDSIFISGQDLRMDIYELVYASHLTGLYYAADDVVIRPLAPDGSPFCERDTTVEIEDPNDPNQTIPVPREVKTELAFPPGSKLVMPSPPFYTTGLGVPNLSNPTWWMKDYTGLFLKVETEEVLPYKVKISATDGSLASTDEEPIMFYLEYADKQIKIEDSSIYVYFNSPGGPYHAEIIGVPAGSPPDTDAVLLPPGDFNLTQTELDKFAEQIILSMDFWSNSAGSNLRGPVVSFNSCTSASPLNIENQSIFDCGGQTGAMYFLYTDSYMAKILNLQRTSFNVRVLSCYEIK